MKAGIELTDLTLVMIRGDRSGIRAGLVIGAVMMSVAATVL